MNTYEAYLNHPAGSILPIEEALQIYTDLVKSVASCTVEDKMEFYQDLQGTREWTIPGGKNWGKSGSGSGILLVLPHI